MQPDQSREQEATQADEERLLALLEHSFDVIVLLDRDATIKYVSPSIIGVLGYTPEEFIGRNGFAPVHPDDISEVRRRFDEVLRQPGSSAAIDARAQHKDGSWRWIESRVTNLLGKPAIGALVVNFRDITERKEFERKLKEREEYWRVALTSIGDAVIITDGTGRV